MRKLGLLLVMTLALAGCAASPADDPDAPVQTVQVEATNMRFTPDAIEVPVGTRLVIEVTNTDSSMMHDLVFDSGVAGDHLAPGASQAIDVGVIRDDLDGWCSISNHRELGMTITVTAVE